MQRYVDRLLEGELRASLSPRLSRGFPGTLEILQPERAWVMRPMEAPGYSSRPDVRVLGIGECLKGAGGFLLKANRGMGSRSRRRPIRDLLTPVSSDS